MDGYEHLRIEPPANAKAPSLAEVRKGASPQAYRETLRTLYEGRGYEPHEVEAIVREQVDG